MDYGNGAIGLSNWQLFRRLAALLGTHPQRVDTAEFLRDDWQRLLVIASHYGVQPTLADTLFGIQHNAPATVTQELTSVLLANSQQQMSAVLQALSAARALNEDGIVPLFLKGTALLLSQGAASVGQRQQVDIDLLVPEQELEPAANALLRTGYTFHLDPRHESEVSSLAQAMHFSRHHHHLPPLFHPDQPMAVELHRSWLPARINTRPASGALYEEANALQRQEARFKTPTPEWHMAHLILGNYVGDGFDARCDFPLKAARDFIALGRQPVLWHAVRQRCPGPFDRFSALVENLMNLDTVPQHNQGRQTKRRLNWMAASHNGVAVRRLLDAQARTRHLCASAVRNPGKLSHYLNRLTLAVTPGKPPASVD